VIRHYFYQPERMYTELKKQLHLDNIGRIVKRQRRLIRRDLVRYIVIRPWGKMT
jgi:hypothetical protein